MSVSIQDVVKLDATDPVGLACADLEPGTSVDVDGGRLIVRDAVPRGHKLALRDLPAGSEVRKYGQPIGLALREIAAGEHVHDHNLRSLSRAGAPQASDQSSATGGRAHSPYPELAARSFDGIVRPDGRVGTRNYVGILSSVNCSATVVKRIAAAFSAPGALDAYPGVDGVVAITHGTGCGMAADGEGLALLRRTLAGYARHPNIGAVVMVGLGCEVNQISALTEDLGLHDPLVIQDLGGSMTTVRAGVEQIRELLPAVAAAGKRRPVPVSKLVLGLNCGGSDAFSGVTANPVLGIAADRLVAAGGTAVLAETPEIQGATHLLTRRAASPEVSRALLERVQWWERYAAAEGGSLDNNPSPGNRAGGITTIEEKALGAVAKGGSSPLRAVYRYAEQVTEPGLVFMDTPGYDPVSVTGIVAGGANVVCFTTGRGSVFGCRPAPSLKLATTSALYERMRDDMDFDCGPVIDGDADVTELGEALFEEILEVASGRRTKSEEFGFGDEEFVPWQLGAVL
ncbi:MAG TPA: altronate dehydratase family protein [Solirubrobacteraceae bacterium]|nr:altronate dehydratase family protein [Solirubrobacteraceae bacterium]